MTRFEKNNLYDEICMALTNYEEGYFRQGAEQEFYSLLRTVSVMWEELTGEDE